MLVERLYEPKDGEILYHYCSGESFAAICNSKRLRLGDLHAMNDFMELHWGYHIWELAAGEVLEIVGNDFLDEIDKIIHSSGLFYPACWNMLLIGWRCFESMAWICKRR